MQVMDPLALIIWKVWKPVPLSLIYVILTILPLSGIAQYCNPHNTLYIWIIVESNRPHYRGEINDKVKKVNEFMNLVLEYWDDTEKQLLHRHTRKVTYVYQFISKLWISFEKSWMLVHISVVGMRRNSEAFQLMFPPSDLAWAAPQPRYSTPTFLEVEPRPLGLIAPQLMPSGVPNHQPPLPRFALQSCAAKSSLSWSLVWEKGYLRWWQKLTLLKTSGRFCHSSCHLKLSFRYQSLTPLTWSLVAFEPEKRRIQASFSYW